MTGIAKLRKAEAEVEELKLVNDILMEGAQLDKDYITKLERVEAAADAYVNRSLGEEDALEDQLLGALANLQKYVTRGPKVIRRNPKG